jgi:DNA-directed RNA polymerase specialized sigma24 family protein
MDLLAYLNEIHRRMLAGDRVASRDLFLAAGEPLRGFLKKKLPPLSYDDRHDLATDAILSYLANPVACDITRSSLWSYLCRNARADGIDLLRKRRRQHTLLHKKVQTDVEFWAARAKDVFKGEDAIDARHIMGLFGHKLVTNDAEVRVLALLLTEEISTSAYAQALGLDPQTPGIEHTVKQAKDRLLLRMKRLRHDL